MSWKVKVKGMKELEREIDKVANEMKDALQMGTEEAANSVASIVRSNAPAGPTGNLQGAVETKPLPRRDGLPEVTMVGLNYNKAPHQALIEFGTGPRYHASGKYVGQMPAQPFFRRSIDGARGLIKNRIEERARGPIKRR